MHTRLQAAYNSIYADEAPALQTLRSDAWPRDRYQAVLYFAGTGKRVLDIGCGNGLVLHNLRERFEELYGVELSDRRVEVARSALRSVNATILIGDIQERLQFPDGYFDCLVCADVIEHIVDPIAALREMYRLTAPGGRLIINTPNVARLKLRLKLLFGKFPSTATGDEGLDMLSGAEVLDNGHLHYFTYSMLEKLVLRVGYKNPVRIGFGRFGRLQNFRPTLLSSSVQIVARK